jgi:hypothetical protein
MRKKLLSIIVLTILSASTLVGCGEGSPCPSTLTILSISEGDVSVMKEGTDDWTEAEVEMELEVGDTMKTGNNSSAEITFFDGSTMEMEAGTEIEILSLDLACDTGVTTITLMQMIGDTISRVEKILDPASSYEVETPTGVAGVRGSVMVVSVGEDGTTWVTNREGNIYANAHGEEVDVPVDQTCIITPGEPPELMPLARDDSAVTLKLHRITIPVLDNDSGDTLSVSTVTQPAHGSIENNGNNVTYIPDADFVGTDSFNYTIMDGHDRTDTATVIVTVNTVQTFADIGVATWQAPSGNIYIWDETSNWWAIDEDTGYAINGTHHETNMTITIAAGRRYYVWVHTLGVSYFVHDEPGDWGIADSPVGGYEAAYGYAYAGLTYNVYFTVPS